MPATLIDTHAHLDDDRFAADLPAVLERAEAAGLAAIFTIGIDVATSRASLALAKQYPLLRAVVGIQPNHVAEIAPGDWEAILQMVREPEVVAIGESGLDRYGPQPRSRCRRNISFGTWNWLGSRRSRSSSIAGKQKRTS